MNTNKSSLTIPGSSPTCIQQSAPDGYFRDEDCEQFNFFVCEIYENGSFSEPLEGEYILDVWI